MRRILALILALPMLLCGCSKSSDPWENFEVGSSDFEFTLSNQGISFGEGDLYNEKIPTFSTPMTAAYDPKGEGDKYLNKLVKGLGPYADNFTAEHTETDTFNTYSFEYREENVSFSVDIYRTLEQEVHFFGHYDGSLGSIVEHARVVLGFDIGAQTLQQLIDYAESNNPNGVTVEDTETGNSISYNGTSSLFMFTREIK